MALPCHSAMSEAELLMPAAAHKLSQFCQSIAFSQPLEEGEAKQR